MTKKLFSLLAIGMLSVMLAVCAGCSSSEPAVSLSKEIKYQNIATVKVPDDWTEAAPVDSESPVAVDIPDGGTLVLSGDYLNDVLNQGYVSDDDITDYIEDYYSNLYSNESYSPADTDNPTEYNITQASLTTTSEQEIICVNDGKTFKGLNRIKTNAGNIAYVLILVPEEDYDEMKDTITRVARSLNVEFANSVDTDRSQKEYDDAMARLDNMQKSSSSASASSTSTPSATVSEQNALKKAKDYLDYSAFSYSGLIEQLEFEGFSNADATYAVDNCGADWNSQAAKKAEQYMEYSAFSRSSLIEQLEFEGFTSEQAAYGATSVGL